MRPVTLRSPLFWALTVSLVLHLALMAVHFSPELKRLKDQLPTLEVMLVNSKSNKAPEKADVLAQANLDRGGNTEQKRLMKSALANMQVTALAPSAQIAPPVAASPATQQEAALQQEKARVALLELEARALMTQLQAKHALQSASPPPRASPVPPTHSARPTLAQPQQPNAISPATLQAIAKLEALIAKEQEAYATRPKRQFIGARTREYRFASYVEQWRQKVERLGNLNYPETAKIQKLHGQLQLTVSIKADGQIESVHIQRSSGYVLLDDAAKRIVQMAAPFAPFPPEIRKDTDILSITRTWTFTQQDEMIAE